ncbi:MAG: hypothetical protein OES46_07985, partial [Gammaproteobacteria bacterium]|nr:hypothetical protein [Gammaproteobacteria bacterium]
ADQTADSRTITGRIIEAMIAHGLAGTSTGDSQKRAHEIAEAYKVIWQAVNNPSNEELDH